MTRQPLRKPQKEFLETLGAAIKSLRKDEGLTQRQAGSRAKIPATRWSEVERGAVDYSLTRLAAIASALHVKPSAIFQRQERTQQSPSSRDDKQRQLATLSQHLDIHQLETLIEMMKLLRTARGD